MRIMLSHMLLALIVALAASACGTTEKEQDQVEGDIPVAVSTAFAKAYPDAVIEAVDTEEHEGRVLYEIETTVDGAERDFVYFADGTLYQIEEEISIDALPQVVTDAVRAAHPDGRIDEVDRITRGDTVEYEVTVEVNDKEFEVLVSSDGKVLSSVQADGDEDEAADVDENDEEDDD